MPPCIDPPSVTLAHQWLVSRRGGESVLLALHKLYPSAPVATLVYRPSYVRGETWQCKDSGNRTRLPRFLTSPLQILPGIWNYYPRLLPLHAWAFGRITVPEGVSLVLSSDAAMIKGLRLPVTARQVCYCHSPPRYLWDLSSHYLAHGRLGWLGRAVFNWTVPRARAFDLAAAGRVDRFIANSHFIADRIRRHYDREAEVIYPPVSVNAYAPQKDIGDFHLLLGQLAPYKRADLAVRTFNRLKRRLVVIGEGSELNSLRKIAGPHIELLGRQPFPVVKYHLERCRALIFPQVEDFGITAVEAQAAGRPVIAHRAGGVLETVLENETGIFFSEQTEESLATAVEQCEHTLLATDQAALQAKCRANSERFSEQQFLKAMSDFLLRHYPDTPPDRLGNPMPNIAPPTASINRPL